MTARRFLAAAAALAAAGAGALAVVAWITDPAPAAAPASPPAPSPASAPAPEPPALDAAAPLLPLPAEPAARERALEENEARARFEGLRRTFAAGRRDVASEARLLPALDALFPARGPPRPALECRGRVCRVALPAAEPGWRERLGSDREVRRQAERTAFEPDGAPVALLELVEARVADGPRPEGERILEELEGVLLASDAARRCVGAGPPPRAADVRLAIDRTGVTYRFGAGLDPAVAYCLMMEAMPDVLASASAPAGVKRAERMVRIAVAP